MGTLKPAAVHRALDDSHPGVRRQAVRLSEEFAASEPDLLATVAAKVADPDAFVRLQTAYTLGEWKSSAAGEALARLLRQDSDRFVKAAALSSALPHAETLMAALQRGGSGGDSLLVEVATVTENAKALASLLSGIAGRSDAADLPASLAALSQLLDWLQRNNKTLAQLQRTADEPMRRALDATDGIFTAARRLATDTASSVADRVTAIRILGRNRARQDEDFELLASLLAPQVPAEVQVATVAALGRTNRPAVPGRGSCVFLHIGGEGGRGTAGCTAMSEPMLRALMQWLDPAQAPVLVQLPLDAYAALRTAWALPALPAAR